MMSWSVTACHTTFRRELDGAWRLRFGPLRAVDIARALSMFVY